jgi:hypothetical protein
MTGGVMRTGFKYPNVFVIHSHAQPVAGASATITPRKQNLVCTRGSTTRHHLGAWHNTIWNTPSSGCMAQHHLEHAII